MMFVLASAVFMISRSRHRLQTDDFDEMAYDTEMKECASDDDDNEHSRYLDGARGHLWGSSGSGLWAGQRSEPGNLFADFRTEESVV
jgi:hypothetical protein